MNQRTYRAVARAALLAPALVVRACCSRRAPGAALSAVRIRSRRALLCATAGIRRLPGTAAGRQTAAGGARRAGAPPRDGADASPRPQAPSPAGAAAPAIEYKEPWAGSLSPQNVLTAYSLPAWPPRQPSRRSRIVDAYNDPTAEHDLKVFDEQFALPACTTANGCFTKVEMRQVPGTAPDERRLGAGDRDRHRGRARPLPELPDPARRGHSTSYSDLEAAEAEAESRGATEISNSWGGPELGVTPAEDNAGPFNHPGIVITASSGDNGYLGWGAPKKNSVEYPASSPTWSRSAAHA